MQGQARESVFFRLTNVCGVTSSVCLIGIEDKLERLHWNDYKYIINLPILAGFVCE